MAVDFKAKQREFTDYIREPERCPAPADVDIRRMAMYRELFFNNIESFLSGNFPVLRAILDGPRWLALVQDFFARHVSKTPYFSEIAEEFLAYLQTERNHPDDLPFLLELAHYEWVEMAVANASEELKINPPGLEQLLDKTLGLSSLAWPLIYQYPVHRIAPTFLPMKPPAQPTYLIVHRNLEDDVKFIEITPITYRLLQLLDENDGMRAETVVEQIVAMLQPPAPERVRQGGFQAIMDLAGKNIITVLD